MKETIERINVVEEGVKQYIKIRASQALNIKNDLSVSQKETKLYVYDAAKDPKQLSADENPSTLNSDTNKFLNQQSLKDKQNTVLKDMTVKEKIQTIVTLHTEIPDIELSDNDKKLLRKLELEHEKQMKSKTVSSASSTVEVHKKKKHVHSTQTKSEEKPKPKLSVRPKQSVNIKLLFLYMMYMFSK